MTTAPHDEGVLGDHEIAALLTGTPWRRIAVLGDSVADRVPAEGSRDRSWVDRVTGALRTAVPGLEVLSLGRRDLRVAEVRERQLAPALAFRPDLAFVAAGGDDALRGSFDADAVRAELEAIVRALRRAGADVVLLRLPDVARAGSVPAGGRPSLGRRMRQLAHLTEAVGLSHGALLVDVRQRPIAADPEICAGERLRLNARGQAMLASETARVLAAAVPLQVAA